MDPTLDLAQRMRAKRSAEGEPYVLLLGAGASIASGTSLNREVVTRVVGRYDLAAFNDYLERCSPDERFSVLREGVEGASPSEGYRALAELIRTGYFDVVLSTNFDPLLEDALAASHMTRCDYLLLVHGVMPPEFIAQHMDLRTPRVKVLKLHGDLFYRTFSYTAEEIRDFPDPVAAILGRLLNYRDLVVLGHSMSDHDINRCLRPTGGSIWYVNPSAPGEDLLPVLSGRQSSANVITGPEGSFDRVLVRLREELLRETAAVSVDRISQAIFAISAPGRPAVGSGFLIANSRLVVTDSTILAALDVGDRPGALVSLRPFRGRTEKRAELALPPKEPLDYVVFRVLDPVAHSPLDLADALPAVGDPVTACISVGEAQGFHDGRVTGVGLTVPVAGNRRRKLELRDLIETDIPVKGGSCGSPIVDRQGRVVAVIVAGNGASYSLTALKLQERLAAAGLWRPDRRNPPAVRP